ncbi:MAG: sn-glycerol-3-phosphate ABC transporter ATP-binding protein UgpC [Proteobacteria bacterium]|nr:sn-glycerol-3-phosphate ABC transporter ATP-binding protein UgpC [Pseudomonadota bacterium]
MAEVHLQKIVKKYGDLEIVHGIDLEIAHNEFLVLVGPSGCGKSTTLRMIAGLESITDGVIKIGDRIVNDLAPRERNISMVFQSYALYSHMNVEENLGFSLTIKKFVKEQIQKRVTEAAEILHLTDLLDRLPGTLSGGQRQRVAMGRAIVRNPDVFLFDEPLSNLDAKLRNTMRTEIKRLHQKVQTTVVYVTHDQVEAMTLADRIVIMKDGYIEQVGSPTEVFEQPKNLFVASFIGSPPMNRVNASITEKNQIKIEGSDLILDLPEKFEGRVNMGQEVILGIRADDIVPKNHGISPVNAFSFKCRVNIAESLGNETLLFIDFGKGEWVSRMLYPEFIEEGTEFEFDLNLEKIHLFDRKTELSL